MLKNAFGNIFFMYAQGAMFWKYLLLLCLQICFSLLELPADIVF